MFVCECLHAQVVSSLRSNVNVATLVKRGDAVTSLPDVSSSSRLPLPPGAALSLWKNQELFRKLYFSKFPVRFAHLSSTSHLSVSETLPSGGQLLLCSVSKRVSLTSWRGNL